MKERDLRFDTLKGILIFLVCFCHALGNFKSYSQNQELINTLYYLIYTFHMPAFVLVSGYFSKKSDYSTSNNKSNLLQNILIPYIIVNSFYWLVFSRKLSGLFVPQYTLWYLLSLFFWKSFIMPISELKGVFFLSIFISLLVGFTKADSFLSIARTINFFPYFLLGFLLQSEFIKKIRGIRKSWVVSVLFVTLLASYGCKIWGVPSDFFQMKSPYGTYELGNIKCIIAHFVSFIIGFSMSFCLISLIPERIPFFTKLGKNTMTVFLFHGVIIRVIKKLISLFYHGDVNQFLVLLFAFLLSFCISAILGSACVFDKYSLIIRSISQRVLKPQASDNQA